MSFRDETPAAAAVVALCSRVGSSPDTVNHAELMLHRHCREGRGSQPALYFERQTYSYEQVGEMAGRCTAWLRSMGIVPGDRVILSMPDCATLVAAYFGVTGAGAVAILMDPALPAEDAFFMAQQCDARLTIAYDRLPGRLPGLRSLPGMLGVVGAGLGWTTPSEFSTAIMARSGPDYVVSGNPNGQAYGLLSSGSTGRPKLIVHRHQDILHGYFGFALPVLGLNAADRVISVAKMTTGYGLGCSILMPFVEGAACALVPESPGSATLAEVIDAHRCSLLFAQPRFLADTVSRPELSNKLQSLRLAVTGGEPLADALLDRWTRFSRVELLDSYGNTEVGFLYITNRPGETRRGSVGRPVEGVEIEVIDEGERPVQPGEIGKLRVRGPMIITGYWKDPGRTGQSFRDGWFVTSDLFSFDLDGYYHIHGRSDHLVKLGCGDWVNPTELELALLQHPCVRECAIIGAPDEQGLTALKAFVVVDPGAAAGPELAGELASVVENRWPMQEYKRLAVLEFTRTLPRTAAGKLDRSRLRPQSMTEFSYRC